MKIREATVQDAEALCRISCQELGYPCKLDFVSARIHSLEKKRERIFIAEDKGIIAGYIHAETYELLYFEPMINILGLAVSSQFRRCGVGKMLLERTEEWAKQEGITVLRCNSGASRKEAHTFYRAMGFHKEKEQIRFLKELEL